MLKRTKIILFFIITAFLIFFGCNKEKSPVPYRHFEVYVDLNCPQFMDIGLGENVYLEKGCTVFENGGSSGLGIIIYRPFPNAFVAFDRMCTSTTHEPTAVKLSSESILYIVCPKCGSKYLISDGSIVSGPANFYLMEFNAVYYPFNNMLKISN